MSRGDPNRRGRRPAPRLVIGIDQPDGLGQPQGRLARLRSDGYLYIALGDGGGSGDPSATRRTSTRCSARSCGSTCDSDAFPPIRRNYAIPTDNRSPGTRRRRRNLGVRSAQSVAAELRPCARRSVHRRCRTEHVGGNRSSACAAATTAGTSSRARTYSTAGRRPAARRSAPIHFYDRSVGQVDHRRLRLSR